MKTPQITINNVLPKYIKTQRWHYFHVFADNKDFYFDIEKMGKKTANSSAKSKILELKTAGEKNIRMYEIEEQEDFRDGEILELKSDCIFQLGEYPL